MATQQSRKMCDICDGPTLHSRSTFSGGMGCLLTILTGGFFIPVWFLIVIIEAFGNPWRCQICGKGRLI